MATYLKYTTFVGNLSDKLIDILGNTDVLKAVIHTDDTALTSNSVSSCTQIGGSNGYTTGGDTITYTCTNSAGTVTLAPSADITWTASGGNLGASTTGRFFEIYDSTSAGTNLICKFDYGATFTVATGETMTLDFGSSLFTLV
jgi:hypothetical protein